jgi:hypothetical protein
LGQILQPRPVDHYFLLKISAALACARIDLSESLRRLAVDRVLGGLMLMTGPHFLPKLD